MEEKIDRFSLPIFRNYLCLTLCVNVVEVLNKVCHNCR